MSRLPFMRDLRGGLNFRPLPRDRSRRVVGQSGSSLALPTRHRSAAGQHVNQSSGERNDAVSSHLATRLAAWT